jgi:hypothetical protein
MAEVFPGRFTACTDAKSTAVFLIGMRFNRLSRPRSWLPVVTAMPRMLQHLLAEPEYGLLGYQNWFGRTTIMVSYWRSAADVQRFASDPDAPHAAAWRDFTRRVGSSGRVGIWHELYTVHRGEYEAVYANMPRFGLGAALEHTPVGPGLRTSKQRMAAAA